jgi:hypothetical protein
MRLALASAVVLALGALGGCGEPSAKPPRPTPWPQAVTPPPETIPRAIPPPGVPPPPPDAVAGASGAAPQAEDPVRKKVGAYFQSVDRLLRAPKHGVPAEVPDAAVLLATLRSRADQVRALEVPEPCAAHHRQLLDLLESAIGLVDRTRALGAGRDQSAQLAFAADRRTLDEQEKQLDALAAEIQQAPPSGS